MAMNPFIVNNLIDSCAFDPKYTPEDEAASRILQMHKNNELKLIIAHSTQKEIEHPNTPIEVKRFSLSMIYTIETGLIREERVLLENIKKILAGEGQIKSIEQDARHIFEAQKYGSYFITADGRILNKRDQLRKICSVVIVKPTEFLQIVEEFKNKTI